MTAKINPSLTPGPDDTTNTDWKPEEVPQLTVDVYRKDDVIYVISTVAGVSPQDLDISIEENTLTIKGVRRKPYKEDPANVQIGRAHV